MMPRILLTLLAPMWLLSLASESPLLFAQSTAPAPSSAKPSAARTKAKKKFKKKSGQVIAPQVQTIASDHFLLHTDLSEEASQELLVRLETMLELISKYWGRPNARPIEMYVVKDVSVWPSGTIPPPGLDAIRSGGGITINRTLQRIDPSGQKEIVAAEAVVYAVSDHGTPQHEAVHAYCAQTFGRTGPVWYAEGMAEMGKYWREQDASVNCGPEVVDYLKSQPPKPLAEITAAGQQTGDSWQNYAWRWALCQLLANNTNYAPRFRPLGLSLLTQQEASFEGVYGSMAEEIAFEYLFFLEHFDRGYRVDLCSWDWSAKFTTLKGAAGVQAKIDAGRGWQASRLSAVKSVTYEYSSMGRWRVDPEEDETTPQGAADGRGKLMGVLWDDYRLSKPFELGESGTWTAPQSGKLFLRCQDDWCDLADNRGTVTVKWKIVK